VHDRILDDLRVGLRNRAIRRRRTRAAATSSATLVLMLAALVGGISFDRSAPALASSAGPDAAALLLHGCDVLKLPKSPQENQGTCVVP
jgi:hypothetical protein